MALLISGALLLIAGAVLRLSTDRAVRVYGAWLMAGGIIFSALAFSVGCAHSKTGKGLNVGVAGTAIWDLAETSKAEDRGAREANPLMGDQEARRWLVKGAGVGAVIGLAAILDSKQRPVLANVVRLVAIAVNVGAALHNASVLR